MAEASSIGMISGFSSFSTEEAAKLRESRGAARGQQAEAAAGSMAVEPKTAQEVGTLQSYFNRTLDVINDVFRAENFTMPAQAKRSDAIFNKMSKLITGD